MVCQESEAVVGARGRGGAQMEELNPEDGQAVAVAVPPQEAAVSVLARELRPQLRRRSGAARRWQPVAHFLGNDVCLLLFLQLLNIYFIILLVLWDDQIKIDYTAQQPPLPLTYQTILQHHIHSSLLI